MAGKTYSLTEAAAILGVHRNTLAKWIDEGCPVVSEADRKRGIEWQISIPDVMDWRINEAVADVLSNYGGDGVRVSKDEADRRRAVAQAITAEVSADEAINRVLSRYDAVSDVARFCVALRTGLGNASAKIAGRAAAMTSAAEIQDMAEAELNRAFVAARGDLGGCWTDGDDAEHSGNGAAQPAS